MSSQIADRLDAEPFRFRSPHDEGVGVVETDVVRHPDSEFSQCCAHLCGREPLFRFENLFADRAGVFGVNIDLAAAQRLPDDDRAAHAGSGLDGEAGTFDGRFGNLAKDVRFGELLRADDDRLRGENGSDDQAEDEKAEFQNATLLCALMKSDTNSLAGESRNSAAVPRCTTRPSFMRTISSARKAASPMSCVTR